MSTLKTAILSKASSASIIRARAVPRLSIRQRARWIENTISISDGRVLQIRPTRPEDINALRKLFGGLSRNEIRMRFLHAMNEVSDRQIKQFTQVDDQGAMNFVLAGIEFYKEQELFGNVQLLSDQSKEWAEFAILVRSDLTGVGIGRLLMEHIICFARKQGIRSIFGESLVENEAMLRLAARMGFSFQDSGDADTLIMFMKL